MASCRLFVAKSSLGCQQYFAHQGTPPLHEFLQHSTSNSERTVIHTITRHHLSEKQIPSSWKMNWCCCFLWRTVWSAADHHIAWIFLTWIGYVWTDLPVSSIQQRHLKMKTVQRMNFSFSPSPFFCKTGCWTIESKTLKCTLVCFYM